MRAISLILPLLAAPAAADLTDPLRFFASCTGRLSAQMEHQWLLQDEAAEQTEATRATMIELVQATMNPGEGRKVLAWRVDAKLAHAALLARATFEDDPWAAGQAERLMLSCTSLLVS